MTCRNKSTEDSNAINNKNNKTTDWADHLSFRLFRQRVKTLWDQLQAQSDGNTHSEHAKWLQYAATVNSSAAYEFDLIARRVLRLHGSVGQWTDSSAVWDNPLNYLDANQHSIIHRWHERLGDWQRLDMPNGLPPAQLPKLEIEFDELCESLKYLKQHVTALNRCMEVDLFNSNGVQLSLLFTDPTPAWTAAKFMVERLERLKGPFEDAINSFRRGGQRPPPKNDGIRRRKPLSKPVSPKINVDSDAESKNLVPDSKDSQVPDSKDPQVSNSKDSQIPKFDLKNHEFYINRFASVFRSLTHIITTFSLPRSFFRIQSRTRTHSAFDSDYPQARAIASFFADTTTLWSLSILLIAASGITIGLSVIQTRPAPCVPAAGLFDDGFWALVSQTCIQLLSLYYAVIPILRDRKFPIRPPLFCLALLLSTITGILAPIIYACVGNWQTTSLLSYGSALASSILGGQLAEAYSRKARDLNEELIS